MMCNGARLVAALVIPSIIALDQAVKWIMLEVVGIAEIPPIEVLPFFRLVMVWNTGVSFGMFAGAGEAASYIVLGVTCTVVLALLIWWWRVQHRAGLYGLSLIIGGALGNIIDRLRFGAVADFFDFHLYGWHWPAFNIADSAIFIGVLLLLIDGWCHSRRSS